MESKKKDLRSSGGEQKEGLRCSGGEQKERFKVPLHICFFVLTAYRGSNYYKVDTRNGFQWVLQ